MPELAIIVPTLGRPERLVPLYQNIIVTTPLRYHVVFVVDEDDEATWRELEPFEGDDCVQTVACSGSYPHKVNVGVAATDTPLVFLTADDVRFHPGWYEEAIEVLPGPADFDVPYVVGTADLHNPRVMAGEYATQMLVTRPYIELGTIDEPGKVFHEGYHHNGVDRELCEAARARGMFTMAMDSVVEHLHPDHGNREADPTDEKGNRKLRGADAVLLEERRRLWVK